MFSYDDNGHMREWLSFDGSGKSTGHTLRVTNKDGGILRRSVYGSNGELSYEQTYDPETETDHFTSFDELGRVKVTWTYVQDKLASYWQEPDSPSQFGDNFSEPRGENDVENYSCHADLKCDLSRVHYEYLDEGKRNPKSAVWRDEEGNLRLAAYFEYEVDSHRNWTLRQVWVWDPSLGQRTLFETDLRTITYWEK